MILFNELTVAPQLLFPRAESTSCKGRYKCIAVMLRTLKGFFLWVMEEEGGCKGGFVVAV